MRTHRRTTAPLSQVCPLPPGNAAFFNELRRVTVDPAGNIWAADFWGSGIHEFTAAGATGTRLTARRRLLRVSPRHTA